MRVGRLTVGLAALAIGSLPFAVTLRVSPTDVEVWTLGRGSSLYVVVYNDRRRVTPITGHDVVVGVSGLDATLTWQPDAPGICDLRIDVPVASLVVDPPGSRERVGLDPSGTLDAFAKEIVARNMRSPMNLDAERHPTITWRSVWCTARADGRFDVTGDLTIRGVTKRFTTPMTVGEERGRFHASGRFFVDHADFGMRPFTYGPLTPRNLEFMEVVVELVGEPHASLP